MPMIIARVRGLVSRARARKQKGASAEEGASPWQGSLRRQVSSFIPRVHGDINSHGAREEGAEPRGIAKVRLHCAHCQSPTAAKHERAGWRWKGGGGGGGTGAGGAWRNKLVAFCPPRFFLTSSTRCPNATAMANGHYTALHHNLQDPTLSC